MRLKCEFRTCKCLYFIQPKSGQKCVKCGHGECWHLLDKSQFKSLRKSAAKPRYIREIINSPIPHDHQNYCLSIDDLPA